MKTLYIDATNSGISGDMFLAGLLGLVENQSEVLKQLEEIKSFLPDVNRLEIDLQTKERLGIQVNFLNIEIKENKSHRTGKALKKALNEFLEAKSYSELAKTYANDVLNDMINAEAEVHGTLAEDVHLHELSSVDTLIDILGVSKVLDQLNAFSEGFSIFCSKLPLGGGVIKAAHGLLPVPAPATSKIIENSNLIVLGGPIDSELVTPTGAALLKNLKLINAPFLTEMKVLKIVNSTGQRNVDNFLNILRLFYGVSKEESSIQKYSEPVVILETEVDDVSGEILGNFFKKIEMEGILSTQVIPTIGKKNRPSQIVKVMCRPEIQFSVIETIIEELGTLGVKYYQINRICVERKEETFKLEVNGKTYDIRYKVSFYESKEGRKVVNVKPEYEDLKTISEKSGLSVKKIEFFAQSEIKNIYLKYSEAKNTQ